MSAAPDWLRAAVVPLAWCWRLARRDGVTIGLTSHDRDLMIDGLLYRAAPGMRPSAIESDDSLAATSMDLSGAVTSSALSAADLDSGRWDGAALTLFLADWSDPAAPVVVMATGELGAVERARAQFTAELQGVTRVLDAPVGPLTSPTCRAMLGDPACRVELNARTHWAQAVALDGRAVQIDAALAGGVLAGGELMWTTGPLTGLASRIVGHAGDTLYLAESFDAHAELPARVRLIEGCDKRLETCRTRFANAVNFRGEAHLPGTDLLTRYPGG